MVATNNKIIIIGAGPSGLFAAYKLIKLNVPGSEILIIDKGHEIQERHFSNSINQDRNFNDEPFISGDGGAGLFSDGKLIFDLYSGGHLEEIISKDKKTQLEKEIGEIISEFKVKSNSKRPNISKESIKNLLKNGFNFNPYPVVHLGSKNLRKFTDDFISILKKYNVQFLHNTYAISISKHIDSWMLNVKNENNNINLLSKFLVVGVGKEGNFWFSSTIEKLGGKSEDNNTYIGIRMEINEDTAKRLYEFALDPKISLNINNKKMKTHCFCKNGQVLLLKYFNMPLVGGHSPYIRMDDEFDSNGYKNSNIAILFRDEKHCNSKKSLKIMEKINQITNGKLLLQRLGDFLNNKETDIESIKNNSISPSNSNYFAGKISNELLPGFHEYFVEFIKRLSLNVEGIDNPDNLLYAPAIEWWMKKIHINPSMEINNLNNIYAIGDGSGWTQGIIQSAATGIIAAEDIFIKEKMKNSNEGFCKSNELIINNVVC